SARHFRNRSRDPSVLSLYRGFTSAWVSLCLARPDRRREISPNHLAESNLVRVEGTVISSSSVDHYAPIDSSNKIACGNDAEKLYPDTGDRLALYRRAQR